MIKSEVIKLTPEYATALLATNTLNRPISKATVERYERAIKRGEWALNGESIIVFSDGTLADGQHRLLAVKKTGIPVDTIIITGIDPKTFGTINGGKTRNGADVLAMSGEVNTVRLSAAARAYLSAHLTARDFTSITATQTKQCVEDHPHLRYWVKKFCNGKMKALIPSGFCGYMAIASEKYGFEKLDTFFDQVSTGVDLKPNDPGFVLRERFISQTNASKLSASHARAFIIKAINAHILGKKLTFLRFVEGEAMPEII